MGNLLRSVLMLATLSAGAASATEASKLIGTVAPEGFAENSTSSKTNSLFLWMSSGGAQFSLQYCSETRAYIRPDDKHVQAAFWALWASGAPMTITVDDSKPIKNGGCQVVAIGSF